ncbi:MAG: thioredoxin domain-containing protein [Candidatus Kryptoniota bacterium]
MELRNKLADSESPYLREASHQPVHWQIYSDEVFKLAKELDRPILLDIGAVWCHWCHVMDNETYSDVEVAEVINKYFVPVKVDRDQMPDVDSRYQTAIGALTGAGGWPLTGFLTSEGKVFYGGTYFPKIDLQGRQGLLTLLPQIADTYAKRKGDVFRSAEEIFQQLKDYELQTIQHDELSGEIIRSVIDNARSKLDKSFGGFGSAPKFFNPTVLLLLSEEAPGQIEDPVRGNDPSLKEIVELTLNCIARGGVYDQLGGGFHRYSVDRYWHVPHFEKMLYDNALMLKAYLLGLQFSRKELYVNVVRETADWITSTMKSPGGAFYAHQDADVGAHDDGTYWTWTRKEVENILTKEEKEIAELYFDIRERPNDTHEFPERNVLRVAVDEKEIAKNCGKSEDEAAKLISSAKKKLIESRNQKQSPFIDKTIFADRNGLAISALVETSLSLKTRKYLEAAEGAADFILKNMVDNQGKVAHAFSGKLLYHGLLDDNVYFGNALLDLFDVTRNDIHIDAAEKIAQVLQDEFEDPEEGGFFDRPSNASKEGLLATKRKPIDDTPTPSGNSGAAIFFDRLFSVTENKKYFEAAERTLKAFAGSADKSGIYAANYARAVRLHLGLLKNVR